MQGGFHRGQGNAHGHSGAEQQAEDEEHVRGAAERAVCLFAQHNFGGGADAQHGRAADMEHVGDGQGGDEVGAPRVGAPVQQKIGQRPVIGLCGHGFRVLGGNDDVPERLDDGPEHHRSGHTGTENHGDPGMQGILGFFVRLAEFDIPVTAAREVYAQTDKPDGDP